MITTTLLLEKADRAIGSAQLLFSTGDYEGACNRAYYAMFDAAKAALLSVQPDSDLSVAKTHNGLIAAFGLQLVKTGLVDAVHGRNLNKGQTLRQLADYTGEQLTANDIERMIDNAKLFYTAISSLIGIQQNL